MTLDPVANLILDEAAELAGPVLVLDDADGGLVHALAEQGRDVWGYCDDLRDAAAIDPAHRLDSLGDPRVGEARVVLLRLGPSLGALEDYAEQLAAAASGPQHVVAGGRVKHMTPGQNEILARSYAQVHASLGRQKCRVLHASEPSPGPRRWPKHRDEPATGLTVWAHGPVFGGTRLDAGTALLVKALDRGLPPATPGRRALDLGCGSGILACWLARRGWDAAASDVSRAAVASTLLTAEANGVRVEAVQSDGLLGVPPASLDLIVTNPPFHVGAAKDSTPTLEMIADARAALAPGGEFWCVFNSHLPYLVALHRDIGPTAIVARDRSYTVTRSVNRS